VPVWNRFRTTAHFEPDHPWLLRFFDRIRWYPVEANLPMDPLSDVLSMLQSMVDGRQVKHSLLVQDVPEDKHNDLDFLVDLIDWERNTDSSFGMKHYIEAIPVADSESEGYVDKWVVYGTFKGEQRFSARELMVQPGASCTLYDDGASGLIVTQGHGTIGNLSVDCPVVIRFGQMTQDEVFISADAAASGVTLVNQSATDPLVTLRYFGPDVHSKMPEVGDHRKENKFA